LARKRVVKYASVTLDALPWVCKSNDLADLAAAQAYKCVYCGCVLTHDNLHIDHKQPCALGGAHSLDNIQITCGDCNRLKHARGDDEFKQFLREFVARLANMK